MPEITLAKQLLGNVEHVCGKDEVGSSHASTVASLIGTPRSQLKPLQVPEGPALRKTPETSRIQVNTRPIM